jgi:hypothetical protein
MGTLWVYSENVAFPKSGQRARARAQRPEAQFRFCLARFGPSFVMTETMDHHGTTTAEGGLVPGPDPAWSGFGTAAPAVAR